MTLKPMDSFGTFSKMKISIFFFFFLGGGGGGLMQNFIELYELLMPC